jgi:glutamine synthetase
MSAKPADPRLATIVAASIGRSEFAERHGLDTNDRREALARVVSDIEEAGIEVVRFSFIDTNGQVRSRPIEARHFPQAARNGVPFTVALFAMDSANFIFQPVFSADGGFGRSTMGGAGDMLAIADLSTFRILPWAKNTASVFADLYLSDGEPCPFDPRRVMRAACAALAERNLLYVGGVEVECHVFKVTDARLGLDSCTQPPVPPQVEAVRHGYQYMSQLVLDEYEPIVDRLRRALIDVGLPLRTLECEWGPGQLEITLDPLIGVDAADAVIMMRLAVKQVARRMGLVASFMSKPGLPNLFSCGWHLHESLAFADGSGNAFLDEAQPISPLGLHFTGGLLKHVRAGTAFSNPTINGYKRLNANPLAPKRAVWSIDNKGAMCRLVGGAGDRATHIENRSGEPLANPYLYMASQIFAGLDGIDTKEDPGDPLADPYGQTSKPLMPGSLMESVEALAGADLFRAKMGGEFVDHFVGMKRNEIGRFLSHVTDWEHQEYFEAF